MKNGLFRRLWSPLLVFLRQGMSPEPLLIIPYVRLGEWLARAPPQPLSIKAGVALLSYDMGRGVHELWDAILHAGLAFLVVAPPAVYLLYRALTPWLRQVAHGLKRAPPAAEIAP